MREYDEHIRLYTPILQRIIILVAVIIAVPVVLWTITAFVRAYVAPPQLPIFRPITAASQTPTQQTQDSAVQVAAQTADTTTASDARGPLLDIRKPSDSAPAANSPAPPPATQQIASTTPAAPPSAAPGAPMSAPSTSAAPPAPAGVPPPPFAASHSLPLTTAAPTNVALANVAPPPAPAVAWPNPAINAPANSGSNTPSTNTVASQEQTATNDSTTDDLPPGVPLTNDKLVVTIFANPSSASISHVYWL